MGSLVVPRGTACSPEPRVLLKTPAMGRSRANTPVGSPLATISVLPVISSVENPSTLPLDPRPCGHGEWEVYMYLRDMDQLRQAWGSIGTLHARVRPRQARGTLACCPSLATTAAVEPVDMPATDGCPPAKNPRGFTLENWSPPATNPLGFLLVDTALLPATCSDVESVLSLAAEPLDALAVPEGTACLSGTGAPLCYLLLALTLSQCFR